MQVQEKKLKKQKNILQVFEKSNLENSNRTEDSKFL